MNIIPVQYLKVPGEFIQNLHKVYEIDMDSLPSMFGRTPIGNSNWYKSPPSDRLVSNYSETSDICPMRGSRRGIECIEGSGMAASYQYFMAKKSGIRFARWCKKTGKRILAIRTKRPVNHWHWRCHQLMNSDFLDGFARGYTGLLKFDQSVGLCRYQKENGDFDAVFLQRDWYEGDFCKGSAIYLLNLTGLSDEIKSSIIDMCDELMDSEVIESRISIRS